MRLIFAGTPEFSAFHLRALIDSPHKLVGVYTQPDRRAGRGKQMLASPVKQLALAHGLSLFQPATLKDAAAQQQLAGLDADIMVVVAYGLLLPLPVLQAPRLGCVNVHASLLPRWRGAAPIQRAIAAGDELTGVTIMQMEEGLDTGAMLLRAECPIHPDDTAASLQERLMHLGAPALLEALRRFEDGNLQAEPQDDALACYAAKLHKHEALLDWRLSAAELHNRIRAFNPFPVAHFQLDGDTVRVWRARVLDKQTPSQVPGTIVGAGPAGIDVACGDGVLQLLELQLPGKKSLPANAILNGYGDRLTVGRQL